MTPAHRRGAPSLFPRLLLWIAGTAVGVALASGAAHYLFAAKLVEASVRTQVETALQSSLAYLERTYSVPLSADLRLLESSPSVERLLEARGAELLIDRPRAERMLLAVTQGNPDLYRSLRVVDEAGRERVIVAGGRRVRELKALGEPAEGDPLRAAMARLFARLRKGAPGRVLFGDPLAAPGEPLSVLAGIAIREPEIGGFGGAVLAHVRLQNYLDYLAGSRVLGSSMAWLFDRAGRTLLAPDPAAQRLDPGPSLFGAAAVPDGAIVVASEPAPDTTLAGRLRLAFSLPPALHSGYLEGIGLIAAGVLAAITVLASLVALFAARQLVRPLRALRDSSAQVSEGRLDARVPEHWPGELGELARAFNRMVASLDETTVSRAYVSNILSSMPDALVVTDRELRITRVNRALCDLLGYAEPELLGAPLGRLFLDPASATRRGPDGVCTGVDTQWRTRGGATVPVYLSSSVMRGPDGAPAGFVCVAQDITERLRSVEELSRSEARLSYAQRVARMGDWEWDMAGDTVHWSREVFRLFGVEPAGSAVTYRSFLERVHPDDRALVERSVEAATARGAPYRIDHRIVRPDGEIRHVHEQAEVLRDLHGNPVRMIGTVIDITERKRAEEALRASENRYRALYDENPSMFFTLDTAQTILSANQFGAFQLGFTPEELVGRPVGMLYLEGDRERVHGHLQGCLASPEDVHRWEAPKLHKSGATLWVRETARVIEDVDGTVRILQVCEDITEAHDLSEQLSYQASHDALTGLVNRRELEARLSRALDGARREQAEHALCYLDLDQFKIINDTCGHVAGDELLRQLADLLQQVVRRNDTLARLGGDEFGVLMEHCSLAQARRVANALRKTVEEFQFAWEDKRFAVGVSIGLVPITAASETIAAVLSAADAACYEAKDGGRNRIHVYREGDVELARRHGEMQWVARINKALDEDRFELCCQPILPIAPHRQAGAHYELLLRMLDEQGRPVKPGLFLPAAERYNLTPRLDRWVVRRSLEWLDGNPAHVAQLFQCAINVSGHSLADEEFLSYITAAFDRTEVPPEKICFEITETAAIANLSSAKRFIGVMREWGCRFALDDFGSGLSSFAYLKNLPVDYLKIDGMFVKDIETDPIDYAMVRAIAEIGRVMGKQTIAEFVESETILERLREIGVHYGQGYALGPPRPLATLTPPTALPHRREA